jgi:hypothetical protein
MQGLRRSSRFSMAVRAGLYRVIPSRHAHGQLIVSVGVGHTHATVAVPARVTALGASQFGDEGAEEEPGTPRLVCAGKRQRTDACACKCMHTRAWCGETDTDRVRTHARTHARTRPHAQPHTRRAHAHAAHAHPWAEVGPCLMWSSVCAHRWGCVRRQRWERSRRRRQTGRRSAATYQNGPPSRRSNAALRTHSDGATGAGTNGHDGGPLALGAVRVS